MADEMQNNAQVQLAVDTALAEQKKKKKKKRLIILGIIVAVIILIAVVAGGSSDSDSDSATSNANSSSTSAVSANSSSSSAVSAEKEEKVDGKLGKYNVTVKSAKIVKNWEGKDTVKITYEFTNNASDSASFDIALSDNLYQNGIGLESTLLSDNDDVDLGFDVKIKPGTTKEVSKVYILRDTKTPIDVEIEELISFSDEKLTYTVELD